MAQISPGASTPPQPPPLVFSLLFASFASSLFIIERGHSASVRHSKALPVMRPENTSGANGRDARYGVPRGREPGQMASGAGRWRRGTGGKKKRKQQEEVFVRGPPQNLQDGRRLRGASSRLKGHEIPFTFSICDVTWRAKVCTPSPATSERKQELGRLFSQTANGGRPRRR